MGGNRTKLNYLRLFAFINPLMLLEIGAKPSIDLSDPQSIADAANAALTRLNEQKDPADDGGFNDAEMFWWMSAPVYDSVLEYSKWTGDTSLNDPAAKSLAGKRSQNMNCHASTVFDSVFEAMSHGLHQNILYGEEPGVSDRRVSVQLPKKEPSPNSD